MQKVGLQKSEKKNNVQNLDLEKVGKKQCAGSEFPARPPEREVWGAASPLEEKEGVLPFCPVRFFAGPFWI